MNEEASELRKASVRRSKYEQRAIVIVCVYGLVTLLVMPSWIKFGAASLLNAGFIVSSLGLAVLAAISVWSIVTYVRALRTFRRLTRAAEKNESKE